VSLITHAYDVYQSSEIYVCLVCHRCQLLLCFLISLLWWLWLLPFDILNVQTENVDIGYSCPKNIRTSFSYTFFSFRVKNPYETDRQTNRRADGQARRGVMRPMRVVRPNNRKERGIPSVRRQSDDAEREAKLCRWYRELCQSVVSITLAMY